MTESHVESQSWRNELPSFDKSVPYTLKTLIFTTSRSPYQELTGSIVPLTQRAFFGHFAGSYELEELCANILVRSVENNDWATAPFTVVAGQGQEGLKKADTEEQALKLGLIAEVPHNHALAAEYHPTKLLIDGIVERLNGNDNFKVVGNAIHNK